MYLLKTTITIGTAVLVGACSTTATPPTPPTPTSIGSYGGQYAFIQNGSTIITSGSTTAIPGGMLSWNNPNLRAYIQDNPDFTAAAIVDRANSNQIYSGISGATAVGVPTTGTATYTGRYGLIRVTAAHGGTPWGFTDVQTSNVDFGAGTITGSGGLYGFAYSATIDGDYISGTVSFDGDGAVTAPLEGGFYGTDTLAGVFTDDATITGVFYGTNP